MKKKMLQSAIPLLQAATVGVATAVLLCVYKFLIQYILTFAKSGYEFVRAHLWAVPPVLAFLLVMALLYAFVYRRLPQIKGGGIPISICAIRGLTPFEGFKNLVGVFWMSLLSFLLGLPLGNEGPSVQMGTAMGAVFSRFFSKRKDLRQEAMTGGACAGFAVATGAPISGILFSVEEAHKKVSAPILLNATVTVLFAAITSRLLSPVLGVSVGLFEQMSLPTLTVEQLWLPLLCGAVLGLFSVAFLHYYRLLDTLSHRKTSKTGYFVKIFVIFALTLAVGLYCFDMVSTGHDLIHHLGEGKMALWLLLAALLLRTTLTLGANVNGITGGIFLPLLALGATVAAMVADLCVRWGLSNEYYLLIVLLGVVGSVAGMMKMPLTAIIFALEALSLHNNLLPVLLTATLTFTITQLFPVDSITETIVERQEKAVKKEIDTVSVC